MVEVLPWARIPVPWGPERKSQSVSGTSRARWHKKNKRRIEAALRNGEWCYVDDLDSLPPRVRKWLKDCRIKLLRRVDGGGSVFPGVPINGYVTEDGTIFYVAEDGSTFYVQES